MNDTTLILRDGTVLLLEKEGETVADVATDATTTGSEGATSEGTEKKADANKQQQGGGLMSMLPMLLIYGVIILALYFIMIRPQRKKSKEEMKMRENLQVGDEIVTIGGIYGRVISLKEDTMVIESKSDHSKITVARWALQQDLTVHEDTEK